MSAETYYQVESTDDEDRPLILAGKSHPLFVPAGGASIPLRFESEEEAFEAAGRYCTKFPFSPFNPLVFKYTAAAPIREQAG